MRVKLDPGAKIPTRAHTKDAGLDIYSRDTMLVPAHGNAIFHTGVHVELPSGSVGMLKSKSGLMVVHDITSEGTIDEEYMGEIIVKLFNHGNRDYTVCEGDKISQLVVLNCIRDTVEIVDEFEYITDRGTNGIGSTGK